ncbi:hypothetical protein [Nostoc sp. C117]|uniref:hypothetical protein n=1 Tax=Nostoc sp. C117 TaxID=3349875 RepID=UPI00370D4086
MLSDPGNCPLLMLLSSLTRQDMPFFVAWINQLFSDLFSDEKRSLYKDSKIGTGALPAIKSKAFCPSRFRNGAVYRSGGY